MTAKDAIGLYKLFDQHGIKIWIDGGWGVDALLGHQTRKHDDLDVAVHHSNLPALCQLLEDRGYHSVPSGGSWGCNFVLGDDRGDRIDLHSFELDTSGENTFGVAYRAEHLTGVGMIEGYQVRCVAPDWMVKFHTGYPLDKNDFSDVKALCEKFEIEMPKEHQAYWDFLAENIIRSETLNDHHAIREIHGLAFGGPVEAKLVDGLRQSGDAIISLVAERDSRVIGHVLFSQLKAPMNALGLAPVAVHPSFQKQGVGLALIREGLAQAKEDGWMCVFVLGEPTYYARFGFRVENAKGYSSPYHGDHFMAVPFGDVPKAGEIVYPEPFKLLD
ncbi:MAG: GNAT family N-acetyltransferase [Verrucomicrobia bacterium]|nr:GNAT family N-acetyltransferase [Verrucomicrobiota bacterium]